MRLNEIQLTERYYKGEKIRIIKAVKDEDGKIIQYKIEDIDKTWTDYVKPSQLTNTK